jgi:hypothetical protein
VNTNMRSKRSTWKISGKTLSCKGTSLIKEIGQKCDMLMPFDVIIKTIVSSA